MKRVIPVAAVLLCSLSAFAQPTDAIQSWTAPPYWMPPAVSPGDGDESGRSAPAAGRHALVASPSALPFFAVTPCRVADTRGYGFTGAYGPPFMAGGVPRNFTITGQCGIPAAAQAVSFNFTVTNTAGPGFLLVFPQGGLQPNVSTLNYLASQTIANAAIVPLGTGGGLGGLTAIPGVSGFDLIVDVNGYYSPLGVVNSLNGQAGDLTLAAGANVSITPSANTLTIASNAGPGGLLPTGTSGQTLRHSGAAWVANSALTSDGTNVALTGALGLPMAVRVTSGAAGSAGSGPFLHNFGYGNTFVGLNAGNFTMTGGNNTASGFEALYSNTTGGHNTASGDQALFWNTTGGGNTATGDNALSHNTTGFNNTASGFQALINNTTGSSNTASGVQALYSDTTGRNNTASGFQALYSNTTGGGNTASGVNALALNTTGGSNTATGFQALFSNTTRSYTTASGRQALYSNTTGGGNTASGDNALAFNTTGGSNTAIGFQALINTTGSNNTAIGRAAGLNLTTGINNIAIGLNAGLNLATGINNIDIGNTGAGESNTIRIGTGQTATFIAGINGATSAGGVAVFVNGSGQLVTTTSSRRFKEDIREIAE